MAEPANDGAIVAVQGSEEPQSGAIVVSSEVRLAGVDLNEIKKLVTQTKAIGVILPPPDIRAIVDKTASFVAKHGLEFEKRILANEKNNVKFNFLVPTDPYHAYYQMRIKEFASEGGEVKDTQALADAVKAATQVQVIPHALQKLEKPEDEMYTVHIPEGLTGQELDTIKLTAQFVARNGKNFLTGLSSREHTNPAFNFLKPTHSLFGFFTSLCDAYSRCLMPPKGTRDRLSKDATDRAGMLERALKRLEWERVRDAEVKEAADEAERERLANQAIDWHDFVVVETIEFFDDEDEELPPPLTLKDVIAMNKAREYADADAAEAEAAEAAAAEKAAAAVPMSEEERALVEQAAAVSIQEEETTAATTQHVDAAPGVEGEAEMDVEMDMDEDEGPIKIVKNYQRPTGPSAMVGGQAYDPTKFAVSPITGELVPITEMAEHMRVSLIDPRWKEQREAMLSKIRDNTRAGDDEITRNLVGLAKTRPDIFGSTDEEVTQVVSESIREKLTSGANRPVAWDGVTTTRGPELHAQLQNIAQSRQQAAAQAPSHHTAAPSGPQRPPGPPAQSFPPPPPMGGAPPPPQQMGMRPGMPPPPPMQRPGMPGMPPPPPRPGMPMMQPPGMGMGMSMGMGMRPPMPMHPPMPPREAPPPMPGDQPDSKRARLGDMFVLTPEEEFLSQHPGPSKVRVQVPEVEGNDKLIGQLMEVEVASLQDTVGELKERLSTVLGLPANKMKLARDGVGFLRDEPSLAHYNVGQDVTLTLGTKDRARGRKGG